VAKTVQDRALNGERGAWDELVHQHEPALLCALQAQGLSLERAQELAQESWVRIWRRAKGGQLEALDLPGLAIRQASFLARDAWRQRERHRLLEPLSTSLHSDPLGQNDAREALSAIESLLADLPERDRQLFESIYRDGLSHREAAAAVALSTQRARQRLCEIRKLIRALPEFAE
jgi:RNA polymerase sigma-70 factor (ECF subfamily)